MTGKVKEKICDKKVQKSVFALLCVLVVCGMVAGTVYGVTHIKGFVRILLKRLFFATLIKFGNKSEGNNT